MSPPRLGLLRGVPDVGGVVDIDANYWTFIDTPSSEYLELTHANGAGDFIRDKFTAVILWERSVLGTQLCFFKDSSTTWAIQPMGNENLRSFVNGYNNTAYPYAAPANELNLVALAYEWTGTTGYFRVVGISNTYGTVSDLNTNASYGPVSGNTDPLTIARNGVGGATTLGDYYAAMFFDEYLADADLENIFDKVKHPTEFASLRLLVSFDQKTVGATYTPEFGAYTFDVYGTPVPGP